MHFNQPPATDMPTFSRQIAGSPTYRATLTEDYQEEAMIGMPHGIYLAEAPLGLLRARLRIPLRYFYAPTCCFRSGDKRAKIEAASPIGFNPAPSPE